MQILRRALRNTATYLGAGSLVRTSGSFVKGLGEVAEAQRTVEFLLQAIPTAESVTADAMVLGFAKPECSYFRARVPNDYEAYSAYVKLDELTDEELDEVRVVNTGECFQLQADEVPVRRTTVVHIITGPYVDNEGVRHEVFYSWSPGDIHPETPLDNATVSLYQGSDR